MTNYNDQVQNILTANGLDFHISKSPLSGKDNEGNQLITPYYGLFNSKSGECINTCKEGYTVSQNGEVVEMILKGTEKFGSDITVQKAGSLNGGRRIYVQLAIAGAGKVNGDIIKQYITAIDSNDGSTGLSVGIGDLTMSCQNQFFKFYKAGEAKFRHTATITEKIKTIPQLIETALNQSIQQIKVYNAFQSTEVSRSLAHSLVKAVLGYDREITSMAERAKLSTKSNNIMDSLYSHIDKEVADKGLNLWGLHSGVTSWTTHEKKGPKRENGQAESLIVGIGYKKNIESFNFAAKYAGLEVVS